MKKIKMLALVVCILLSTNVVLAEENKDYATQMEEIQEYFMNNPGLSRAEKKVYIQDNLVLPDEVQEYFDKNPDLTPAEKKAYLEEYAEDNNIDIPKKEEINKKCHNKSNMNRRNKRQFNRKMRRMKRHHNEYHHNDTTSETSDNTTSDSDI